MKNKAINTITYTGIVKLSQYIGNKKVQIAQRHNTGGSSLFNFLADCLIGDFDIAKNTRPTKIMLIKRTKTSDLETYRFESKSGFIFLLSKPEKIDGDGQCKVRYSFIVPKELILGIDSLEGLGMGLFTYDAPGATETDLNNYAAFCDLNLAKNALTNASLVVDWELIISNVNSQINS